MIREKERKRGRSEKRNGKPRREKIKNKKMLIN